jgi:hypothetical protein
VYYNRLPLSKTGEEPDLRTGCAPRSAKGHLYQNTIFSPSCPMRGSKAAVKLPKPLLLNTAADEALFD